VQIWFFNSKMIATGARKIAVKIFGVCCQKIIANSPLSANMFFEWRCNF